MRIFLLFILFYTRISFAMEPQPDNLTCPLLTVLVPKMQLRTLDFNPSLNHAVQNNIIISVLYVPGSEYIRTYKPDQNGYSCFYSGRMLSHGTLINPEVVKQSFPLLIHEYGLKDKTPQQIMAGCILSRK